MIPTVVLTDVHRSFGPIEVLSGVTLRTEPGETVALYGRSGSGKTTLLNLVGGLDSPSSGSVQIGGQDLASLAPEWLSELRRTGMGFIFQSYGLLSHLTAAENVEFALRLAGVGRREWRERTLDALDAVGLTGRSHHRPLELSGGERQRVAIARVLAARPRLVLADEPTGALDHATGLTVIDLLVDYARSSGACVWIATHDQSIAGRVDRVLRIQNGCLLEQEVAVK